MPEYTLPPLPYPKEALEPNIGAKTMEIHHDKHHQAYVTNANNALKDPPRMFSGTLSRCWISSSTGMLSNCGWSLRALLALVT